MERDLAMERAEVLAHVRAHVVPAVAGRKCIDGRYQPGQGSGRLARPGADVGYVLALLAACRAKGLATPPEVIADAVIAAVTRDGGAFSLHTDDHAGVPALRNGAAGPAIGCAHVAAAVDAATGPAYFPAGTPNAGADAGAALDRVLDRWRAGDRIEMTTLRGEHRERAVLLVVGERRTVEPWPGDSFVYDERRDRGYLFRTLGPALAPLGVDADDLWAAARHQLAATVALVAPNLGVWTVDADGPEPVVEHAGSVQSLYLGDRRNAAGA